MTVEYPGATPYTDRHGRERWRYRRKGKTVALPRHPGHPEFEAAYRAAVSGLPVELAQLRRLPGASHPHSLRAAWRLVTATIDWSTLGPVSKANQTAIAERFLSTQIAAGEATRYGDLPIDELKRRHVREILARWSGTPHAAAHILRLLRKLTGAALDAEWIEQDPTYRIKFRPAFKGWKAWPADVRAAFERKWPLGSTPRTAYALALYQGHRRGDVAVIRWSDLEAAGSSIVQHKTGKALWVPMHPNLVAALEAAPRRGETVVVTQYGRPFSHKALGMRMQDWTALAGIKPGYTLHGLRKTLGKLLAESGATTRQIMAILGHSDIAHAELYTREAEQRKLAIDDMDKLRLVTSRG
jgi:integrase